MMNKQYRLFIIYSLIIFSLLVSFSLIAYCSVAGSINYQQRLKSIQLMKEERAEHFHTHHNKTELVSTDDSNSGELPQLYFIANKQYIVKMPDYGSKLIRQIYQVLPHAQPIHHQHIALNQQHYTIASNQVANQWWIYTIIDSTEAYHSLRQLKVTLFGLVIIYSFLNIWIGYLLSKNAIIPYQQAAEREQRFVQDAAHELKTPLQVIKTGTEVVMSYESSHLSIIGKETLTDIQEEINSMSYLINQLLDLNRYSRQLPLDTLNLSALLPVWIKRHPSRCHTHIQQDIFIKGHQESLKQLLYIALDNAVKYNTDPTITITLSQTDKVNLVIHDNGYGVESDVLPHIFERFYRSTAEQHIQGSGIGLSLLKTIVSAHHGTVTASNESGLKLVITFPKI